MDLQHGLGFVGLFVHQEERHFTRVAGFLLILGHDVRFSLESLLFQAITLQEQWHVFPQYTPHWYELLPPTYDEVAAWFPWLHPGHATLVLRHPGDGTVLGPNHQGNTAEGNTLAKLSKYPPFPRTLIGCLDGQTESVCNVTILACPNIIGYTVGPYVAQCYSVRTGVVVELKLLDDSILNNTV